MSRFPTIDKLTLLQHFDELITVSDVSQSELRAFDEQEAANREPFKGKYHVIHSSGSTGKPGYFIYDEDAWCEMLVGIVRAALWGMSMPQIFKLLKGVTKIAYIAATYGRYGGAMAVGDGIDGVGAKQIHLDVNQPINEWLTKLKEFGPNMVIGYPSAIKILGELVEHGEIRLNIFRVITCGEPLGAGMRAYFEKVFGAEIINVYGASESLALGVEKDPKDGMMLFDDMNVIEVENDEMYLTSLYNFAQPIIRYRLSDVLELTPANGKYPFTRIKGLLGRDEQNMWFKADGRTDFIHPLSIEGICIEGLIDYQFAKQSDTKFLMFSQVLEGADKKAIKAEISEFLTSLLAEKQIDYVDFDVTFVEEILPDPQTGKKQLIISLLKEREAV